MQDLKLPFPAAVTSKGKHNGELTTSQLWGKFRENDLPEGVIYPVK